MFFAWLRTQARDAVLAGVSDAAGEIDRSTVDGIPAALASLRARLTALPAPAPEPEPTGARKGRKATE